MKKRAASPHHESFRAKLLEDVIDNIPDTWEGMIDLAERADVHPNTLWFWYHGYTASPRIVTLCKVAEEMGFTIELVKVQRLRLVK